MSILLIPIAIMTFGKINHFAYETNKFIESLPYLALQLNTVLVWLCVGIYWLYPLKYDATATFGELYVS